MNDWKVAKYSGSKNARIVYSHCVTTSPEIFFNPVPSLIPCFFLVFNHLASIHYNGSFEIIRLGDLSSQLDNLVDGGFITYYWFGGGVGDGPCLGIYSASRSSCKSKIGD